MVEFGDGKRALYKCQGEPAAAVISYIKELVQTHYGREIPVKSGSLPSLLPSDKEISISDRLFGFPVKKYSKRFNAIEDRILCLTSNEICICDGSIVQSSHALSDIAIIKVFKENADKFTIEYSNSSKASPSTFYSSGRDIIIANIMEVYQNTHPASEVPIIDLSGCGAGFSPADDLLYLRSSFSQKLDGESEDYFLKKLFKLSSLPLSPSSSINNNNDMNNNNNGYSGVGNLSMEVYMNLVSTLKEFNFYIRRSFVIQSKEKKVISFLFDWLKYFHQCYERDIKNQKIISLIVDLLQTTQKLLASKTIYSEVKTVKEAVRVLEDLLRCPNSIIASSAAQTILFIIEQPKLIEAKLKSEGLNKGHFLTADGSLLSSVLSLLVQSVSANTIQQNQHHYHNSAAEPPSTLLIYHLLSIFSCMVGNISGSTERSWLNNIIPRVSRGSMLSAIFELCRSECFAIGFKSSLILKVILQSNNGEQLYQVQEMARQLLAMLYQLYQAIDARYPKQKVLSGELCGLMIEGNSSSTLLLKRIFPKGVILLLKENERKSRLVNVVNEIRSKNDPLSKQKFNWKGWFEFIVGLDNCSPTLVWNNDTRKELADALQSEMTRFENEKDQNKDITKVWNSEEFSVQYPSLQSLLIVKNCYLTVLLQNPDQFEIPPSSSLRFLLQIYQQLTIEKRSENRGIYIRAMSWCYSRYQNDIRTVFFMGNLVNLLRKNMNPKDPRTMDLYSVIHIFDFLITSFNYSKKNIRLFIENEGIEITSLAIKRVHQTPSDLYYKSADLALQIMLYCVILVESTDEKGCIKIPVPVSKKLLTSPSVLPFIVQSLLASSDQVVNNAAILLDKLLDKNDTITSTLHRRTGIIYFILYYSGSAAASAMAKLLQTIHTQQDPHLLRRFIPDSMALLLQDSSNDFSEVFYQNAHLPQVIWTPQMKSILSTSIANHLQSFMQQLIPYTVDHSSNYIDPNNDLSRISENVVYSLGDMDAIVYPGLDEELRCGNYYIRNLIEYPSWNVDSPEDVIKDAMKIIQSHHSFLLSSSYLSHNNIQSGGGGGNNDEEVKNKKMFEVSLLLKASSILFKNKKARKKTEFKNFEYYATVLKMVELDRNTPNFSPENIQIINSAIELIFLSVWTSDQNLNNFLDMKGLSYLSTLLYCCSRNLGNQQCYSIVLFVFKIVCRILPSPNARSQVAKDTDIIRDILSCLIVGQPADIVSLAMQCIIELSEVQSLSDSLYQSGAHYYLLDFILSFDPTVLPSSQSQPLPKDDHNVVNQQQTEINECAVRSCIVLATISGVYSTKLLSPIEHKFQKILNHLLTQGIVQMMRVKSEIKFLESLNDPTLLIETPEAIWNYSAKIELVSYIRSRIKSLQKLSSSSSSLSYSSNNNNEYGGENNETMDLTFQFSCHSNELNVNGIFLRLYRTNPEWKISNPKDFLLALLSHLSHSIDRLSSSSSSADVSEYQIETVCISIYYVLNANQGLEKMVVTPDSLRLFFSILNQYNTPSKASSNNSNEIQPIVLSIFLLATSNQLCVDELCYVDRLEQFSYLLYPSNVHRSLVLDILSNMVASSSKAVIGLITSGILLFLFHLIFPVHYHNNNNNNSNSGGGEEEKENQLRVQAAGVLKQMESAAIIDTRFLEICHLFFPRYLIAILEKPSSDFLYFFDQNHAIPDLIWNDLTRDFAFNLIHKELSSLIQLKENKRVRGEGYQWNILSIPPIQYAEITGQIQVGDVYIDLYNQQPRYRLFDPKNFLEKGFQYLGTLSSNPLAYEQLVYNVIQSIHQLVTNRPEWVHYIADLPSPSFIPFLILYRDTSNYDLLLLYSKLIGLIAHAGESVCKLQSAAHILLPALLSPEKTILPPLSSSISPSITSTIEELSLRSLFLLIQKENASSSSVFIKHLMDLSNNNTTGDILSSLIAIVEKQNNSSKFAQQILKMVYNDKRFSAAVKAAVGINKEPLILSDMGAIKMKADWITLPPLNLSSYRPTASSFEVDSLDRQSIYKSSSSQRSSSQFVIKSKSPSFYSPSPSPSPSTPSLGNYTYPPPAPSYSSPPPIPSPSPQPNNFNNNNGYNNNIIIQEEYREETITKQQMIPPPIPSLPPPSILPPSPMPSIQPIPVIPQPFSPIQPQSPLPIQPPPQMQPQMPSHMPTPTQLPSQPPPQIQPQPSSLITPSGGPPPPPPPPPLLISTPKLITPPSSLSSALSSTNLTPTPQHSSSENTSEGRNELLDAIRQGKQLKKVDLDEVKNDTKNKEVEGGDGLMNALADALAARRTRIVTNLADNPFGDDDDDDDDDNDDDWDD